jgi:hypothetical protein
MNNKQRKEIQARLPALMSDKLKQLRAAAQHDWKRASVAASLIKEAAVQAYIKYLTNLLDEVTECPDRMLAIGLNEESVDIAPNGYGASKVANAMFRHTASANSSALSLSGSFAEVCSAVRYAQLKDYDDFIRASKSSLATGRIRRLEAIMKDPSDFFRHPENTANLKNGDVLSDAELKAHLNDFIHNTGVQI